MGGPGIELRMDILRKSATQQIIKPLQMHGWESTICTEDTNGEFLIIEATKSNVLRKVALMYSSATDNRYYKQLDAIVDHIFTNGALYKIESFAYGINRPVSPIDDFFPVLVQWNKDLAPKTNIAMEKFRIRTVRRITTERPIEGIWAYLSQLTSTTLAEKLVKRRLMEVETTALTPAQVATKAAGIAFTIRNAVDYFREAPHESLNKRILSLYYGSLALAFAEMLASPNGPIDLDDVEGMTKQGHGLFTVPSTTNDFGDFHVGVLATGFFARWADFLGYSTSDYPKQKAKTASDLEKLKPTTTKTIGELFAALPELGGLFSEVYELEPSWVIPAPDNASHFSQHRRAPDSTYILLIDRSAKISSQRIECAPWPISEFTEVKNDEAAEKHYRVRVDHPNCKYWHQVLPIHGSPFIESGTLILPSIGDVTEYRAISLSILYALSILVRYMPSAWRRVEGGDWDQHLTLVRTTLDIFERLIPQEFLESITGERVYAKLPGSF